MACGVSHAPLAWHTGLEPVTQFPLASELMPHIAAGCYLHPATGQTGIEPATLTAAHTAALPLSYCPVYAPELTLPRRCRATRL